MRYVTLERLANADSIPARLTEPCGEEAADLLGTSNDVRPPGEKEVEGAAAGSVDRSVGDFGVVAASADLGDDTSSGFFSS
mmetsp:Transcript_27621/g.47695  ORF Transcript_27621/g.47695 Transcript_27621/m.47695 type:complete len:81 (+) Transcript_27621:479-721(+)